MKKKVLAIAAFFVFVSLHAENVGMCAGTCYSPDSRSTSYTYHPQSSVHHQQKPSGLFAKYFNSLMIGGLVGAVSGVMCYAADQQFPSWFMVVTWPLFSTLRETILEAMADDFNHYGVRYNYKLMTGIARLSDWAIYLVLWRKVLPTVVNKISTIPSSISPRLNLTFPHDRQS